jgi:hypothetical protein
VLSEMAASDNKYLIIKNILTAVLIAVGMFATLVFLSISWIKIIVIGAAILSSIIWLKSRGLLRRTVKYTLFSILLFSISFSAFEGYLFQYASYPPTFGTSQQPSLTFSYPEMLTVSLTEMVQNVENTPAFKLLMFEHPGEVKIERITLNGLLHRRGQIAVQFYQESSGIGFTFSSNGGPYHVSVGKMWGTTTKPQHYQIQPQKTLLERIDTLGLQWYCDRALEEYQNKAETSFEITDLIITISAINHSSYPGLQIQLIGLCGGENSSYAYFAYFHPDGTIMNFSAFT